MLFCCSLQPTSRATVHVSWRKGFFLCGVLHDRHAHTASYSRSVCFCYGDTRRLILDILFSCANDVPWTRTFYLPPRAVRISCFLEFSPDILLNLCH